MTSNDTRKLTKYIIGFLKEYGNFPVEHAICIRNDNTIFETLEGQPTTCSIRGDMRDGDIIHNHPNAPPLLSGNDVIAAATLDAKTITAVSKRHKTWCTLARPASGWKIEHYHRPYVESVFEYAYENIHKTHGRLFLDLAKSVASGEISTYDADVVLNSIANETAFRKLKLYKQLSLREIPKSALDEGSAELKTLGLIGILVLGVAAVAYIMSKRELPQ